MLLWVPASDGEEVVAGPSRLGPKKRTRSRVGEESHMMMMMIIITIIVIVIITIIIVFIIVIRIFVVINYC